jgi:hypothetical protein
VLWSGGSISRSSHTSAASLSSGRTEGHTTTRSRREDRRACEHVLLWRCCDPIACPSPGTRAAASPAAPVELPAPQPRCAAQPLLRTHSAQAARLPGPCQSPSPATQPTRAP